MLAKVQKWGHSQGVRLPRQILRSANLDLGDEVKVAVRNGQIVITPSDRVHGKYRLEEPLARMPEDYEPSEEDWDLRSVARKDRKGSQNRRRDRPR